MIFVTNQGQERGQDGRPLSSSRRRFDAYQREIYELLLDPDLEIVGPEAVNEVEYERRLFLWYILHDFCLDRNEAQDRAWAVGYQLRTAHNFLITCKPDVYCSCVLGANCTTTFNRAADTRSDGPHQQAADEFVKLGYITNGTYNDWASQT